MKRAVLVGLLAFSLGCRPFDEVLDQTLLNLADAGQPAMGGGGGTTSDDGGTTGGGGGATSDDGGATGGGGGATGDDGGATGDDGGMTDGGGGDADAGTTDAGAADAGAPDAGPRCTLGPPVTLQALGQLAGQPVSVASVGWAWLVSGTLLSNGTIAVAKVGDALVSPGFEALGCSGPCTGARVARADVGAANWYAVTWSQGLTLRWTLAAGGAPTIVTNASLTCPGTTGADLVATPDASVLVTSCTGGLQLYDATSGSGRQGDYAGRTARVARNASGAAWLGYTTDAGFQLTPLDLANVTYFNGLLTPVPLGSIAVDVSPSGAPWLAGIATNGSIRLFSVGFQDAGVEWPLSASTKPTAPGGVGLAAGSDGLVVAFASAIPNNDTLYVRPVRRDGGLDPLIELTSSGAAPQAAWSDELGRYALTWISGDQGFLAELHCRDD